MTGCGYISYSWPGESRILPEEEKQKQKQKQKQKRKRRRRKRQHNVGLFEILFFFRVIKRLMGKRSKIFYKPAHSVYAHTWKDNNKPSMIKKKKKKSLSSELKKKKKPETWSFFDIQAILGGLISLFRIMNERWSIIIQSTGEWRKQKKKNANKTRRERERNRARENKAEELKET